jgi:argininosuccinate lyase
MSKLWQKSSTDTRSEAAKKTESFTVGNDYILDLELVPYDVRGSEVHAKALQKAGIISVEEFGMLKKGLRKIQEAWNKGEFRIRVEDEDMHTAIENFLTDELGELGKKIHTGRSRNDQVLTALRLYEKESLGSILDQVKTCAGLLIDFGEKFEKIPMPGFTHTRKAMPCSVALWAGGFAEMLILQGQAAKGVFCLVDKSPLGTAAGFGTTFNIDREYEAKELGFDGPLVCSTTAQLSRGWIELQVVQFLAGITAVLNRLSSDLIQYSSEAYGYFDLDEVVCTGSSIMPQKKNPDVAELLRGGHSELIGYCATLQSVTQNLISGYHRDLQLTKEPIIKAFQKTEQLLDAACLLIENVKPNEEKCRNACTAEIFAADRANRMVMDEGISFREAYQRVGNNPDEGTETDLDGFLKNYTHLGAPGNAGLSKLKSMMKFIR